MSRATPFAVHFLRQRRPLNVFRKTLGHQSLSTTSNYAQVNNEELKSNVGSPPFQ